MHDTALRSAPARLLGATLTSLVLLVGASASPAAAASDIHVDQILSGYSRPVLVTSTGAANRRIFIVEQSGKIRIATFAGGHWQKVGVFLDLSHKVDFDDSERGLLGLAFAPDYKTSGRFYVAYTARRHGGGCCGPDVVVAYRRKSGDKADPASARTVMSVGDPYENHNGGDIAFGPDHLLYIGEGDGGSGGDPEDRSQSLGSRLGKMLRINPRDPDGKGPRHYSVPASNPYVGRAGLDEIWASGFRNPWRWSFDRLTGDLWVGDVGQNQYEEIDFASATAGKNAGKGLNFGWNKQEGLHDFDKGDFDAVEPLCTTNCHTLPVYEYDHGEGCAVIGGYVFRGPGSPAWYGTYVFSDSCSGQLWAMDIDLHSIIDSVSTGLSVSGFGEDAAGRLFVTDLGGTISTLTFTGAPA